MRQTREGSESRVSSRPFFFFDKIPAAPERALEICLYSPNGDEVVLFASKTLSFLRAFLLNFSPGVPEPSLPDVSGVFGVPGVAVLLAGLSAILDLLFLRFALGVVGAEGADVDVDKGAGEAGAEVDGDADTSWEEALRFLDLLDDFEGFS